ncbi:MAG TPA: hypothetical protein VFD60_11410 [Nitrososphaeraceae archaeon]|nr:hypothetical protein [Nitrososphaeraceae archaeon]
MYSNFIGLVNIFTFLLELCGSSKVMFLQKIQTLLFSQEDYDNTTRTKKIALTCNLGVRQWSIWIADENT